MLKTYMDEMNLTYIRRIRNEEARQYSGFRYNPVPCFSRIDFTLISQGLIPYVDNIKYSPGFRSDHSFIEIELEISNQLEEEECGN